MKILFTWAPDGIRLAQPSADDPDDGKFARTEQWFQVTIPDDAEGVTLEYAVPARFDRLLRQWTEDDE